MRKKILIISSIIFVIILVIGILMISKGKTSKSVQESKDIKSKNINYINNKEGENNKLAILLYDTDNPKYAITIDENKEVIFEKDYLELEEDNSNIELELNGMSSKGIKFRDEDISIDIEETYFDREDNEIIEKNNRWFLTKEDLEDDIYYHIYFSLENHENSEEEYSIKAIDFGLLDDESDTEIKAKEVFNKIVEKLNVYKVSKETNDNRLEYTDFDNNNVNLSEYKFARDIIAKSLNKYNIYIKEPKGIVEYDNLYEGKIWYKSEDIEGNKMKFAIKTIESDEYENRIKEKEAYDFKYNGKEYKILYDNKKESAYVYFRPNESMYIEIYVSINGINASKENMNIYEKKIEEQLL